MAKQKKRGRGQPTKYTDEMPELLLEHFDIPAYVESKDGPKASDFPTIASFACKVGVNKTTLYAWAKTHPEFSDVMGRAKDYQERYLMANGSKGLIPPTFFVFTCKNVLGWRDQRDTRPEESDDAFSENYANWEKRKSER